MEKEKLIDWKTAIRRVPADQLDQVLAPVFDRKAVAAAKIIAKGLPAGPGAATGRMYLNADRAVQAAERGEKVLLVRNETSPEDLRGMIAAEGILTAKGGVRSTRPGSRSGRCEASSPASPAFRRCSARDGDTFELTGPDAALLAAPRQGHVAAQRMVLVGGEISALLLGFALVAAIGLRRGVWNESRRLAQRGARRSQVWLAVATEVGSMALAGAVAGLLAGVAGGDRRSPRPPGCRPVRFSSTRSSRSSGSLIAAGAWAVATVAIVVAVRAPERRRRAGGVRLARRGGARRGARGRDRPQHAGRRAPGRSRGRPAPATAAPRPRLLRRRGRWPAACSAR